MIASTVRRPLATIILVTAAFAVLATAGPATAEITPTRDANAIAQAIADPLAPGILTDATFQTIPPAPDTTPECSDGEDNDFDGFIDAGPGGDPGCPNAADNREEEDVPPECSDGFDNDDDGKTDFAEGDAGCLSDADLDEGSEGPSLTPECSDGLDNDFDGETDFADDPSCANSLDNREQDDLEPQCSDGFDNDFDDLIDFAGGDLGCVSALDDAEENGVPNPTAECSDGFDNDDDGKTDFIGGDLGCSSPDDIDESSEGEPIPAEPECADGQDNDFDDLNDLADPGCSSPTDNREEDDAVAQCDDGDDNDLDEDTDLDDPGCDSATDNDEESDGLPPAQDPNPTATSDSSLTGLPFSGETWAILTSGNSTFADRANTSGSTGQSNGGGDGGHGPSFEDVVTLKVNLNVPAAANCLSVDFRFLSDEFPEFVGNSVNDAFVAELDVSDFSADSSQNNRVIAPHNFAFDGQGEVISINTTGATEMSAAEAAGTTYDGATPRLRAFTSITPGAHAVYFSIFDQGDSVYDSAVFLDNLVVFTAPVGGCKEGATPDLTPPDTTITAGPTGTTEDNTPTFEFTSTEAGSTFECRIDAGDWAPCSTPHTTAALAAGQHTFEVRAIDPAGNVDPSPASRTFTVANPDTTPPDTTITSGPSNPIPTADNTPTFTFTSTEAGSTFECRLDDAVDWTSCTTPHTTAQLSDGEHTIHVRAKDAADNTDQTPASRTFTVDTTPPNTVITSGPSGPTADTTPTFEFNAPGEPGASFECRLDGAGAWVSCTSPHTTGTLSDGQHTIEVRAKDALGNTDQSPASRTFTVDTTPPDTTITSGPTGLTADNTPTFAFTSTEAGSTFECRLDDAVTWASCSSPHTTAALSDGEHSIHVRATDALGNTDQTPASRTFTVDTTPPQTQITDAPSDPTSDGTPTFEFDAPGEPGATFECKLDDAPDWTPCSSPHTTAPLADGEHTFQVRAKDAVGNVDQSPASFTFTVADQDTTPPDTAITSGPSGPTQDNTPTFEFNAPGEPAATFECRLDGAGAWVSCSSPHTTGTLSDGQHTIEVRAKDAVGNTDQTPASRAFTVDTTPPDTVITSGPSGPTQDNTPTFEFSSTESGSTLECSLDGGGWVPCSSPHTTAALADGQHTIQVRARDGLGNVDPSPASRTFTVQTSTPPPPGPTCNGQAATKVGTPGKDKIVGTRRRDVIVALGGRDKISGKGGNDLICAGSGDDKVDAGDGADVVMGEDGNDRLRGGSGNDKLDGGDGRDRIWGDRGNDQLVGAAGRDHLSGGPGNDHLNGGADRDRCRGGSGTNQRQSCER